MCGIFGYCDFEGTKTQEEMCRILITGLERIEYRGYDSAGVCVFNRGVQKVYEKAVGKVECLKKRLEEKAKQDKGRFLCMAHTRWATHGESSERNAHPIRSDHNGTFYVVHNGIISNYKKHKKDLSKEGHVFETDTDTEVAAKLCLKHYREGMTFLEVVKKVIGECEGQYAFLFLSPKFPDEMIAAQSGAPIIIGMKSPMGDFKQDKEKNCYQLDIENETDFIISSDISAIVEHTAEVVYVNVDEIAVMRPGSIEIYGSTREVRITKLDNHLVSVDKGEFSHYMIKEIHEQCDSLSNTIRERVNFEMGNVKMETLETHLETLLNAKRFLFIACGTSYHSSLAVKKIFEYLTDRPVVVQPSSDFLDNRPSVGNQDVVFFISQSGETADSISAMNYCHSKGATTIGVTNTQNSTIARMAACSVDVRAGIEKGVASTKAYTSQFMTNVLIALYISQERGTNNEKRKEIIAEVEKIPGKVKKCLELALDSHVDRLYDNDSILVIGRGYQVSTCFEGSLKIKEISYIHSEGIMAGELKHGSLALVCSQIGIIVIIADDEFYEKSHNALEQIMARNGQPLVICPESICDRYNWSIAVPDSIDCLQGLLTVIPLQLISYKLAVKKGIDPDFPRNLAKSVTVE